MAATTTDDLPSLFLIVIFVYPGNVFNMPSFFVWAGYIVAFLLGIVTIIDKLCPEFNIAIGKWIISHVRRPFSR